MLRKITAITIMLFVFVGVFTQAQDVNKKAPIVAITGNEVVLEKSFTIPQYKPTVFPNVVTSLATFTFTATGITSIYDLQSNGSPNEIVQDINTPDNIHIYFMTALDAAYADRGGIYQFSDDGGMTWTNYGKVPTVKSGFPTISLLPSGAAVVACHTNEGGISTRSQAYIDQDAGVGTFTRYPAADNADGDPIWPRVLAIDADNIALVASISGGANAYTTNLDLSATTPAFAAYTVYSGDQAETYKLAKSDDGMTVGHLYVADAAVANGDVFYRESTDKGVTWGPEVLLWDWRVEGDSMGGLRGLDLTFVGNEPHAVFELGKITDAGNYFPSYPSSIMYWTPNENGGVPTVLADSSNIPYNVNPVASCVFLPVCRPSISASTDGRALFCVMNAATENFSADTITYYGGYFTASFDGGKSWEAPVRFTPDVLPVKDWRFFSISPKTAVNGDTAIVHMVVQTRDTAGVLVQEGPAGTLAEEVYIQAKVVLPVNGVNDIASVNSFELGQNYPNPFNPSTTIKYSVAKSGNVVLKVYDVLGREVANLVNGVKEAGSYSVTFDASKLSTGLYIYTINSGNFTATKKMMLVK